VIAHPEPEPAGAATALDVVAGLLASLAIFVGLVAIFYRPVRVAPAAILIALIAAGMSARWRRLASIGVAVGALGWLAGLSIAVVLKHPIW
jgi:hypothetical protein